ncbi:hypothetical protein BDV96DRAFT_644784 [Lophiotrema nucula]|uniref:Uncharacterized protein n=1 Tax=Lophiotrema nucula TaxID=690887 RepID=A0A6A5ZCX2_9PLEO|nr:hypothetical protein BDV96DRAFT_644784 [Lophiotrema nucula]
MEAVYFAPPQQLTAIRWAVTRLKWFQNRLVEVKGEQSVLRRELKQAQKERRLTPSVKDTHRKEGKRLDNLRNRLEWKIKNRLDDLDRHAVAAYGNLWDLFGSKLPRELRDAVYNCAAPNDVISGTCYIGSVVKPYTIMLASGHCCDVTLESYPVCGDHAAHPNLRIEMAQHLLGSVHFKVTRFERLEALLQSPGGFGAGLPPCTFIHILEVDMHLVNGSAEVRERLARGFELLADVRHASPRITINLRSEADQVSPRNLLEFVYRVKPVLDHLLELKKRDITVWHQRSPVRFTPLRKQLLSDVLYAHSDNVEKMLLKHFKGYNKTEGIEEIGRLQKPCYEIVEDKWIRLDGPST